MIDTRQVLNAVTTMQQNAQASLPVIPNNGNPAGAHNMPPQGTAPQATQATTPRQQSPYYYPWLAPSPHMESLTGFLAQRQEKLMGMMQGYAPQPIAPQAPPQPSVAQPVQQMPPVIPMAQAINQTVI